MTIIEASKQDWTAQSPAATAEDIKSGCLQRIAASTEAMAKNYIRLLNELEFCKQRNDRLVGENERLAHSNAGLRGYLKRMKERP